MADKVKPLKIENSATGGTQNDPFSVETNPTQDYLAAKGIAFENSDTYLMDKSSSNNIQVRSFESHIFNREHILDDSTNYIVPIDTQFLLFNYLKITGLLTIDSSLIVME